MPHLSDALHQPLQGDVALTERLLGRQVGVQGVQGHDARPPAVPGVTGGRGQPRILLALGPLVPGVQVAVIVWLVRDLARAVTGNLLRALLVNIVAAIFTLESLFEHPDQELIIRFE